MQHGDRLAALSGRTLTGTSVVWDSSTDTWFADGPVLLDFDGEQVEINHHNLHDLSITWNTIDPTMPITWPIDGFALHWRHDVPGELANVHGRRLSAIDLLEWTGADIARGMVALCFTFSGRHLTVYNGLDENALTLSAPGPRYTRHPTPKPITPDQAGGFTP